MLMSKSHVELVLPIDSCRRDGPAPHQLPHTEALAQCWHWKAGPSGVGEGELAWPLTGCHKAVPGVA